MINSPNKTDDFIKVDINSLSKTDGFIKMINSLSKTNDFIKMMHSLSKTNDFVKMINSLSKTGLGTSGHVRFQTFGPIWHASGPKIVFLLNDIMILLHFCWSSSIIKFF